MHKDYILFGGVRFRKSLVTFKEAKKYEPSLSEEEFKLIIKHGTPSKKDVFAAQKENVKLKNEIKDLKAEIKKLKKTSAEN